MALPTEQHLLPKEIFVGDNAELRISFSNPQELQIASQIENTNPDFLIKNIRLESDANNYTAIIEFVPWKQGEIILPAFNLVSTEEKKANTIEIQPEAIEVASILAKTNSNQIRPQKGAMLIPGTNWILYLFVISGIVIFVGIFFLLVKLPGLIFGYKNFLKKLRLKKNASKAIKKIRKLFKSKVSDKDFASDLQKILRLYLEGRYSEKFSTCTSSELPKKFMDVTQGLLSDEIYSQMEKFYSLFYRTDFIRYSAQANLNEGERKALLTCARDTIFILERGI